MPDGLDKGELEMQACLFNRIPYGPAELHDDRLLPLFQGVKGAGYNKQNHYCQYS